MLNLNYLFEDSEVSFDGTADTTGLSDYTTLDFVSGESHIYGEIMWPGKEFLSERPCVIMLHGFPGSARNDDISHALCRIGCVVIVPHHRGAVENTLSQIVSRMPRTSCSLPARTISSENTKSILIKFFCSDTAWGQIPP